MKMFITIVLTILVFECTESRNLDFSDVPNGRYQSWADSAVEFLRNLTCRDAFLTTEEDCHRLAQIPKEEMNVYLAEPTSEGRLKAVLQDGPLNRVLAHDAVLVLDPYPTANLGHLLVVFFVDVEWTELQCEVAGGEYIGDGACLTLALRKRCHNLLLQGKWKLKYNLKKLHRNKHCEINFFPLVYVDGEVPNQVEQRLNCRDDIAGFAPCPTLRPQNKTDMLVCDPLKLNTDSCSTTRETVRTRCRRFERCDHAVLLSGGWDRLTSRPEYKTDMLSMYTMLKENGFPDDNIKMFYANGENSDHYEPERLYPSAFKATMRYHIRKLCQSPNCADSLVIYLHSPTRNDGTSLLWDIDGNGQADENEVYTVRELLYDVQDCAAQRVYIIADQGHSGQLIHALERSNRHSNVLAFASGHVHEYSWQGEYTSLWRNFRHASGCVEEVHQIAEATMKSSKPLFYDGSNGDIKTTLFGAPCNIKPPFSVRELEKDYFGCQNLPASVWIQWRKTLQNRR